MKSRQLICLVLLVCLAGASNNAPSADAGVPEVQSMELPSGLLGPRAGIFTDTIRIIPLDFGPEQGYEYRFSDTAAWLPLNQILLLDAFEGELRSYTLHIKARSAPSTSSIRLTYTIDRTIPEVPAFQTTGGVVKGEFELRFDPDRLRAGDAVWYCLNPDLGFVQYDPLFPVRFQALADRTQYIEVAANTRSATGRCSPVVSDGWQLIPNGLVPSFPLSATPPAASLKRLARDELTELRLESSSRGSLGLNLEFSCASQMVFYFLSAEPPVRFSQFVAARPSNGTLSFTIPRPVGYFEELVLYVGVLDNKELRYTELRLSGRQQSELVLTDLVNEPFDTYLPEPEVLSLAGGWIFFQSGKAGLTRYAIDEHQEAVLERPVAISATEAGKLLTWTLKSSRTEPDERTGQIRLATPTRPHDPSISGISHDETVGRRVSIRLESVDPVKFALGRNEAAPQITVDSPDFPAVLELEASEGALEIFQLRLVPYADSGLAGNERIIDFVMRGTRPAEPRIELRADTETNAGFTVQLTAEPGSRIYYTIVTEHNSNQDYQEYSAPVLVEAQIADRLSYTVMAYAVDEYGNRSLSPASASYILDPVSIYVDTASLQSGDGSPLAPFGSLDQALLLAARTKRNQIKIRGDVVLKAPIRSTSSLFLLGGYDEQWEQSTDSPSLLDWQPGVANAAVFENASLGFRNLRVLLRVSGTAPVFQLTNGSLDIDRCTVGLEGLTDGSVFRIANGQLSLSRSELRLDRGLAYRLFDLASVELRLNASRLQIGSAVRVFELLRAVDSEVLVRDLHVEASPSLSFSGFVLTTTTLDLESCNLLVQASSSVCRFFTMLSSTIRLLDLYASADCRGAVEFLRASAGSGIDLLYSSVVLGGTRVTGFILDDSSLLAANSILHSQTAAAALVSVSSGSTFWFGSNCFWGFSTLMETAPRPVSLASFNDYIRSGTRPARTSLQQPPLFLDNFAEDTAITFLAPSKGVRNISPQSKCDNGSVPIPGYEQYTSIGHTRR